MPILSQKYKEIETVAKSCRLAVIFVRNVLPELTRKPTPIYYKVSAVTPRKFFVALQKECERRHLTRWTPKRY